MNAQKIPLPKTHEEWLAQRRKGIGGSDSAAILGLSPFKTPLAVWLEKTGQATEQDETPAMRFGTAMEDYVAQTYSKETGRAVAPLDYSLQDGIYLGNIDRLILADNDNSLPPSILECKTTSRRADWENGIPLYYQTQVQHYLSLMPEVSDAYVATLDRITLQFSIHRLERDEETIALMRDRLAQWWQKHVINSDIPDPTNETDCKLLYARSNPGKRVEATPEDTANIDTLKRIRAEIASLEEIEEAPRSKICASMKDAETLCDSNGRPLATWKSSKPTRKTDWKALAAELALPTETINRFTTESAPVRRFLVK